MLTTIRDNVTGWVAAIIVGLLIISFALWGVSFYFTQTSQINIAEVNDKPIKLQDYQRMLYNMREQMPDERELSEEEEELIKKQALSAMINAEVISRVTNKENFQVSNENVRTAIRNLEAFQDEESGFDRRAYERSLLNIGMEPADFESRVRADILSAQLQSAIRESAFSLDSETNRILDLRNRKKGIKYTILSPDSYKDEIEIDEEGLQEFYKNNSNRYREKEQVKIAYLDLDAEKLAEELEISEGDLRTYYIDNKEQFTLPEQRSFTRLFAKAEEDTTEEELEKAKSDIEEIAAMVKEGKTFEEIIEIQNEQNTANIEFSEYGPTQREVMPEEVDEFLFSANEGEVSDPIQSKDGFHIVKAGILEGGPDNNTFDKLREQVDAGYRRAQADNQFIEQADILAELTYEQPDLLEPAAEAVGLEIHETGFFSQEGGEVEITRQAEIIAASFSDEVKNAGNNSAIIEISDNRSVVVRVVDQQPERLRPLEEIKELATQEMRILKAQEKAKELGDIIIAKLKADEEPSTIAEEHQFEWTEEKNIKRDSVAVNRAILRAVFRLGTLQDDAPVYEGVQTGDGSYAVMIVSNAEETEEPQTANAEEPETEEELRKTVHDELIRRFADNEWRQFLNEAKNHTDITIYRDNL